MAASGVSCTFLEIAANFNETLVVTDYSEDVSKFATSQGVYCDAGFYDLDGDRMWIISRVFLAIALALMILSALVSWGITLTIVKASWRLWRCISAFAAVSAVMQIPVFLIFEVEPCSQYESSQTCILSTGSYLLVGSLLVSITVTLITQCLDPPFEELQLLCTTAKHNKREQDTDSSLDDSDEGADGSLFTQLGACIRKAMSREDEETDTKEPPSQRLSMKQTNSASVHHGVSRSDVTLVSPVKSSVPRLVVGDIEQGLRSNPSVDDTTANHRGTETVGEESTQWESFASIFEIKPTKRESPTRPHDGSSPIAQPAPKPTLSAVIPALAQAKADKSVQVKADKASIFRNSSRLSVPFDETPPRKNGVQPASKESKDPPGMLGQELAMEETNKGRSTVSLSLSNDGGKPPTPSRRGRLLRGYALLDDDSGSTFLQSPPLEIVTLKQMPQIENDDDSIDLGFGIPVEEDDDMEDYFKSIQLHPITVSAPRLDLNSEVDVVFGTPFHGEDSRLGEAAEQEKIARELKVSTDDGSDSRTKGKDEGLADEQALIVEEVLRRRGGRHKKQRRKKSLGCSSSAASYQSLLDITIEEETPEDLLREEQVDPYTDGLLVRTRSAPNLAAYSFVGGATDNCKSYECAHVKGINSFRVAETYWSDEEDQTSQQPRLVTPDAVSPRALYNHRDGLSFSSDPTERSRRARIARIQRLQRENQHLMHSLGGGEEDQAAHKPSYPPPTPKRPRATLVGPDDIADLIFIEAQRPKGAEYGPDEASL
jgi:hypothetical protein